MVSVAMLVAGGALCPADQLVIGEPLAGSLAATDTMDSQGKFQDVHTLTLEQGQTVTITLSSEDFDSFLVVRSPGGVETSDDDGAGNLNSRAVFVEEIEALLHPEE